MALFRCVAAALTLFALGLNAEANPADEGRMRFTVLQQRPGDGDLRQIFAEGAIDADAAARFRQFLATNNIPRRSTVYLDSPGGIVQEGMKLGHLIRDAGLQTAIGEMSLAGNGRILPGYCNSACTLTFLGGTYRSIDPASKYGVHRFFGADMTGDNAQIVSADIVQYIADMGVDSGLFSEMTRAGASQINILSPAKLKALHVTNDGPTPTGWTVESSDHFVFLKGQRQTPAGLQRFLLTCNGAELWSYVTFDPNGHADEAIAKPLASFQIDNQSLRIAKADILSPPHVSGGLISAIFRVDPAVRSRLFKAKTVGIKLQTGYDTPGFDGFVQMDFSGALPKLGGALKQCSG